MATGRAPAKRQPRQSRAELRSILVETGRAILREEGMGTGAETLTFKRVFERVEQDRGLRLTNASVIRRVWDNQADFQTDVLIAIAADEGADEFDRTLEAVLPVLASADLSTPESRWATMSEVCRVGGASTLVTLSESPNWPSWIGLWTLSAVGSLPQHRQPVSEALSCGYEALATHFEQAYSALIGLLGLRLRHPLTIRHFTVAVEALSEGCMLRVRMDPASLYDIRITGRDGVERTWTLLGLGLDALARQFLEEDPDALPATGSG